MSPYWNADVKSKLMRAQWIWLSFSDEDRVTVERSNGDESKFYFDSSVEYGRDDPRFGGSISEGVWVVEITAWQKTVLASLPDEYPPRFIVRLDSHTNAHLESVGLHFDTLWVEAAEYEFLFDMTVGPEDSARFGHKHV